MATIRARKKKDGSISYRAEIVIKQDGEVAHRESKSFRTNKLAKVWASKRELELQETQVFGKSKRIPISELIDDYLDSFEVGRSKRYDLLRLRNCDIAKIDAHKLTSKDIIKHCLMRLETVLPQTVNNDVIWLKAVLDTMKGVHNYKYDMTMFTPAYAVMRKEGIITKSAQRDRRPTSPELMILSRHFRRKPHYLHYMWFAIFSARRLSEIAKLRRSDIKHENRTILVRDMKSPKKEQLSLRAKLPRSAYKLIQRHGSKGDVIFPYNPKSVSTAFTRACKLLGIKDLVFHDLRHEATSRLFEAGLNIPQVQKVTLHQDWKSLARYTNLCHDDIDI